MRFHRPAAPAERATVSVVIPCYRYGNYLPTAVASVLEQEDVDVDVLVIDDASDDDSAQVARSLADQDMRVRVVVHTANAGHIATYNEGLNQVKGDYVVLLSADDALVPGSLARAVALMQRHPRVGLVYGHCAYFTDEPPRADRAARSWTTWPGRQWLTWMCSRSTNPVYTPGVVMRRTAWDDVGRYDARVPHAGDMLLWYQTAARWDVGRVNNEAQALYRVHGTNMHLTQYAGMLRDMQEQRTLLGILFEETPPAHLPPARVRESALRSIVRRANRLAIAESRDPSGDGSADAFRRFSAETTALLGGHGVSPALVAWDAWLESRWGGLPRRAVRHLWWRLWRRYGV